jgi:tetratricopeptide (TPR) repeat protein
MAFVKTLAQFMIICYCLFHHLSASCQGNTRNKFFEADYALQLNDYETALKLYKDLLKRDPDNALYNYKVGQCLLNLPDVKKTALPYLKVAVLSVSENFKEGSFGETSTPTETYFLIAKAYHLNEDLDNATDYYYKYLNYTNDKSRIKYVNDQIKACEYAKTFMNNPVSVDVEKLAAPINSEHSEIYPVISDDESMLVYLESTERSNIVYITKKEGGKWTKPVNINNAIGSFNDSYPSSISADKTRIYFSVKNNFSSTICYSALENNRWSKMKKLKSPVNTKSWNSHAFESSSGNELYFVSDRKGGFGGLDIYKSIKNKKGKWGNPENLGSTINTYLNEIMPIVTPDNNTLYFCSEGHTSIGGYDVFMSVRNPSGNWTDPVNLGYPINTTDDNVYYRPLGDGTYAYCSLPREENISDFDICKMEILPERIFVLKGSLALQNDFPYFGDCRITLINADMMDTVDVIYPSPFSGDYQYELQAGNYEVVFTKDLYVPQVEKLVLDNDYSPKEIVINPKLEKLEVEEEKIAEVPIEEEITAEVPAEEEAAEIIAEVPAEEEVPAAAVAETPSEEPAEEETYYTHTESYDRTYHEKKPEGKLIYTIQVMALKKPVQIDYFNNIPGINVQIGNDGYYRYITGQFDDKAMLMKELSRIKKLGYENAFIRKLDMNEYLSAYNNGYDNRHTKEIYTIQIMALRNPVSLTYFKNLKDLKVSYGSDKLFRYTYNEYDSYGSAVNGLKEVKSSGYSEAFIRKISDISNY